MYVEGALECDSPFLGLLPIHDATYTQLDPPSPLERRIRSSVFFRQGVWTLHVRSQARDHRTGQETRKDAWDRVHDNSGKLALIISTLEAYHAVRRCKRASTLGPLLSAPCSMHVCSLFCQPNSTVHDNDS